MYHRLCMYRVACYTSYMRRSVIASGKQNLRTPVRLPAASAAHLSFSSKLIVIEVSMDTVS